MVSSVVTRNWPDSCCFTFFIWQPYTTWWAMTARTKQTTVTKNIPSIITYVFRAIRYRSVTYSRYFCFVFNDDARRQRLTPTNEVETTEIIAGDDDVGRSQYASNIMTNDIITLYRFANSISLCGVRTAQNQQVVAEDGYRNGMKRSTSLKRLHGSNIRLVPSSVRRRKT